MDGKIAPITGALSGTGAGRRARVMDGKIAPITGALSGTGAGQ